MLNHVQSFSRQPILTYSQDNIFQPLCSALSTGPVQAGCRFKWRLQQEGGCGNRGIFPIASRVPFKGGPKWVDPHSVSVSFGRSVSYWGEGITGWWRKYGLMRMMLVASLCKQLKPVLGKTLNHRKKAMGAIDGLFADSSNDQLIGHTIDLGVLWMVGSS